MQIRELNKSDLTLRVKWMNEPAVYSSMHYAIPVLIENTLRWYEKNKDNDSRSDVVFVEENEIVAFGGLTSITPSPRMAELYLFVAPYSQHKGVGKAATSLLCEWGFKKLGLEKIYLYTNEDNLPAIAVYEKNGFSLEGRHRQEYLAPDGSIKDRLYFGLLRSEWMK